mmetsp:Transcript_115159/g.273753  ORF Transcript_115159/g.273753 Transcript_115159/m.273753 type:complete len:215 (+) Transcript_115159:484-1128(+)
MLGALREVFGDIFHPGLQKRIDIQRSDLPIGRQSLGNGHGAIACEHADLEHLLRLLHEGEHLHELSLRGICGHLLSVGKHGRLRFCQVRPGGLSHLFRDSPHCRALGSRMISDIRVHGSNQHVHLLGQAFDPLGEDRPLGGASAPGPGRGPGLLLLVHRFSHILCLGSVKTANISVATAGLACQLPLTFEASCSCHRHSGQGCRQQWCCKRGGA